MKYITIIAEAGVNHNGNPDLAFQLIQAAADAKADIVKFQTFNTFEVLTAQAPKAAYQKRQTGGGQSQLEMVRALELAPELHAELVARCRKAGIAFLSTPFDLASVDLLADLGMPCFKIPSGEITNLPYLRKIGALKRDVFLSTGMSTLGDIEAALAALEAAGTPRHAVILLHCTTEYPAPIEEVNLRAMKTLECAFPGIAGVGYSDHTQGIAIPVAAAALGATVIEKHFTLDKTMDGPDHRASLEPDELAAMVAAVRQVEAALGDGIKAPSPSERPNMAVARKSLVAARPIRAGEPFTAQNLTAKRPGTGISPMRWDEFMGKSASRDYQKDELIMP